jgi:hypothetical protein
MAIKLLDIFRKHFGNRLNFSEDDYLYSCGKGVDALLYSVIFMPELIEIKSRVFMKGNIYDKSKVLNALNSSETAKEVEISFNYVEVGYIFSTSGRDTSDDEDVILAYRIRDSWDGWLKVKYPDRKFVVTVISHEETGSTVGVQFYESS